MYVVTSLRTEIFNVAYALELIQICDVWTHALEFGIQNVSKLILNDLKNIWEIKEALKLRM